MNADKAFWFLSAFIGGQRFGFAALTPGIVKR